MTMLQFLKGTFKPGTFLKVAPLLLFIPLLWLFNPANQAISKDNQTMVPKDFKLELVSAGRGINANERNTVTINKAGACEYWEQDNIAGADKNKRNYSKFTISNNSVTRIYQTIGSEGFFGLKTKYKDTEIYDGDLVLLAVTANKQSKQVMAINIGVDAIDNIVLQINKELPDQYDIDYNALRGFNLMRVER